MDEKERQSGDDQFRALFELAAVGIAYVTIDGKWLLVNQKVCDIVGHPREELIGQSFQDVTYPADLPNDLAHVQRLLSNQGQSNSWEKRYVRKDGSLAWVHLTTVVILDRDGRPDHFITILQDIGERKREEQERSRLLLAERVEAQGREAALLEANHRMEEFLGIAAHELRTPLTSIKANVQLAMRSLNAALEQSERLVEVGGNRTRSALEMLSRAERQIGVLNRLVGDMVDTSRLQVGGMQLGLRKKKSDLLTIVSEVVRERRTSTPGRTILLRLPALDRVPVMVDSDRIAQVVTNYLDNALKYSEAEKPVEVRVTVERQLARVSVHDEGPGLSDEEQQRAWQCFYQVPGVNAVSGSGVGLGLGLFISQAIIERHEGQVGVYSRPGEGSTFWFALPLVNQRNGMRE